MRGKKKCSTLDTTIVYMKILNDISNTRTCISDAFQMCVTKLTFVFGQLLLTYGQILLLLLFEVLHCKNCLYLGQYCGVCVLYFSSLYNF